MKTASPETLDLAPKDLPLKTGPSYAAASAPIAMMYGLKLTLMVNVALSCEIGVALAGDFGIWRGVFWTVARKRACTAGLVSRLAAVNGSSAAGR